MSSELLFEVGVEELPARFMTRALEDLKARAEEELAAARLVDAQVEVWGTPRRLTLHVTGLPERQSDLEEEFKGPAWSACFNADGTPTRAALGFAQSRGVDVLDLKPKPMGKTEYACVLVKQQGEKVSHLLPQILTTLLSKLVFPKNMYWADPTVRFARPIRWLVCLLDDKVLPFAYNGIAAGATTRGHRFMGHQAVEVPHAKRYLDLLFDNYVIADPLKRRERMLQAMSKLENTIDGTIELDEDLIVENLYLTEYPVPFMGHFDESYLEVPEQVLVTSMKANQKYFACRSKEGRLLPLFVGISNNAPANMDKIREGNERVLKGRLDDAVFFWTEDQKEPLSRKVELLKDVTYQEQLGSVYDKTKWLESYVRELCQAAGKAELADDAARAALLSKADLVTQMVGEFPELQGVMGHIYAERSGEKTTVAAAIEEQYLPRFAGDSLPTSLLGALLGLAERIYNMVGAYKCGYMATSSQDPYGLRRAARCVNELFFSPLGLDLDLYAAFARAAEIFELGDEKLQDLWNFYRTRTLIQLKERGFNSKLAEMAFNLTGTQPYQLLKLLQALQSSSNQPWFGQLSEASGRVANLLEKSQGQLPTVDASLFEKEAEKALNHALESTAEPLKTSLENKDWTGAMQTLSSLAEPVKAFFDDVMVMAEDEAVKKNRLALLAKADALFSQVGNLAAVKGK